LHFDLGLDFDSDLAEIYGWGKREEWLSLLAGSNESTLHREKFWGPMGCTLKKLNLSYYNKV